MGAAGSACAQLYPFEILTEKDGLPSSSVYDISQDPSGVMWFATRVGIATYDGLQWDSPHPLPNRDNDEMAHLECDRLGRIWAASLRSPLQVVYWEDGQMHTLPTRDWERRDHTTHGFKVRIAADGRPLVVLTSSAGHVWVWNGESWLDFPPDPERGLLRTFDFLDGRLLAASDQGLLEIDIEEHRIRPYTIPGLPEGRLQTLHQDPRRPLLWLVGQDWVGQYENGRFRMLAEDLAMVLPTTRIGVVACTDPVDGLYFGDPTRVYHFSEERGQLTPLTRRSGLAGEGTHSLFRDREGNLWFCGQRGLSKLISKRFTLHDQQHGLLRDEVTAILMRPNGEVVLGHDGGLTFMGPPLRTLDLGTRGQILGRVMDLEEDRAGNLWVAADRLGLAWLDPAGTLNWLDELDGSRYNAFCLASEPDGTLWLGTSRGLFKREGGRFQPVALPGVAAGENNFIRRIEPAPDGTLLAVAGVFGVFRIEKGEVRSLLDASLADGNFYTALQKPAGEIWVGASRGLFLLKDGKLEPSRPPSPEIHSSLHCMLETAEGKTWFGTENGALVWDGQKLRAMSSREGLLGSDTNRDALKQDAQGRVWIGTDRGLSIYNPRQDLPPTAQPLVQLLSLEADGQSYPTDRPIRLDAPPSLLVADFRIVTFVKSRGLGLRTWLEGLEDDWQESLPLYQRSIRYARLQPGTYRLHLQAARGDSLIGPEIVSAEIKVLPPFYLRWWFILPAALAAVLLLRMVFGVYSQVRYSNQLENEVQERTRELKESREAIRYRSRRFQTTLDSVSDGVVTVDGAGRVVLCNPAASRILGLEPEDLEDRQLAEVLPRSRELVPDRADEFDYQNPQRGPIWLEALITPLAQVGSHNPGQVLVLRDITARRMQEAELNRTQKLESLGVLAGGLAHDFNNLLTIILGNIDLVEGLPDLPSQGGSRLSKAKRATIQARTLTEQLLTFARGGAPRRRLVSLAQILDQTVNLVFTRKEYECKIELPADLWPVSADGSQLNQVISNLLLNAIQAMPQGGLVYVFGTNIDQAPDFLSPGQYVMLEIRDQGEGISPRNLLKIFDPYFSTREGASGLGLATAYSHRQAAWRSPEGHLRGGQRFLFPGLPAAGPGASGR
jgi:PAS domain S-box-containing protein